MVTTASHMVLGHLTTEIAREYLTLGLDIHPVPRAGDNKAPVDWWLKRRATVADFVDPNTNIGLKTGSAYGNDSFIADIDLDMKDPATKQSFPGAAIVLDELLPDCAHVFGRKSARRSHRLYVTTEPVFSKKYESVHKHGVLVELRGLAAKTKKCQQTVIAPGTHASGERIEWAGNFSGQFSRVDAMGLQESVKDTAVALAILEIWPAVGMRHDARLAFAKLLLEAKLDTRACTGILKAVVKATGGDVSDVDICVSDTHKILQRDVAQAIGIAWVKDHLGDAGLKTVAAIHKFLGVKTRNGLDVDNMDLKTFTPKIWNRVKETNDPPRLFLQGGLPVRVVHIPERRALKKQTFVFQPAVRDVLRNEVAQVQEFTMSRGNNFVQVAPPDVILKNMLASEPKDIPLPAVTRIVYAPTVAPDGSIQLSPGYQEATGTFYVPNGLVVPPVKSEPSFDDVQAALATLREPIAQFPFVGDSDRAHALAFMLLPFVRDLIDGPTPLHLFEKSTAGEGASLLTDVLLYPAVGGDIARLTACDDDDEWRKSITSTLLEGPSVVLIDNVRSLVSPVLAKVLTDRIWQARILGFSRNATLEVECVWGATGINPTLHQEIVRRVVRSRLDSGEEHPWLRTGFAISDLQQWSREHRGEMIHAALTLIRYWFVQGQKPGSRILGMFESWSRALGGIFDAAGVPGFLTELEAFYEEADIEGDAIRWFVHTWVEHHQSNPVTLSAVAMWALASDSPVVAMLHAKNDTGARVALGAFVKRLRRRVVNVHNVKMTLEPFKEQTNVSRSTYYVRKLGGDPLRVGSESLPFQSLL